MSDTKDTIDRQQHTNEAPAQQPSQAPALSADDQMVQDAFNALLEDYMKSNHRRKVEPNPISRQTMRATAIGCMM